MIYAVIPAAGKSTRMGRPKLSLPINGRPVLQLVLDALHLAGVNQTVVVIGPHVTELAPVAEAAGAHPLLLSHETPDMRATVEQGLLWLERRFRPAAEDAWLLVPADHPALDAEVIRAVIAEGAGKGRSIVVPTFQGRRGHPVLIGWSHVHGIRRLPEGTGLNGYLRRQEADVWELPVPSDGVLLDLDTPADYEKMRRRLEKGDISG